STIAGGSGLRFISACRRGGDPCSDAAGGFAFLTRSNPGLTTSRFLGVQPGGGGPKLPAAISTEIASLATSRFPRRPCTYLRRTCQASPRRAGGDPRFDLPSAFRCSADVARRREPGWRRASPDAGPTASGRRARRRRGEHGAIALRDAGARQEPALGDHPV